MNEVDGTVRQRVLYIYVLEDCGKAISDKSHSREFADVFERIGSAGCKTTEEEWTDCSVYD